MYMLLTSTEPLGHSPDGYSSVYAILLFGDLSGNFVCVGCIETTDNLGDGKLKFLIWDEIPTNMCQALGVIDPTVDPCLFLKAFNYFFPKSIFIFLDFKVYIGSTPSPLVYVL